MKKHDLEQVKKLAEQLTAKERGELWEFLTRLPDSGIQSTPLPASFKLALKQKEALEGKQLQQVSFRFGWKTLDDGNVIYTLDDIEIFRLSFDAENCANLLFEKTKIDKPFLQLPPDKHKEYFAKAREKAGVQGAKISDAKLRKLVQPALLEICKRLVKQSIEDATKHAKSNLPLILHVTFQKVIQAIYFSGTNKLRDKIEQPSTKFSAKEVIDAVFQSDIELVKILAGVTPGGKRKRKSAFVWDEDKAIKFYQAVEALPRHGANKLPMWEYAQEVLRDNDYDHETIQFLMGRSMFSSVLDGLLSEAAIVWRKHDENWDSLLPADSPQAFAFRHICGQLGYTYTTYNTARTNYYRGKKALGSKG